MRTHGKRFHFRAGLFANGEGDGLIPCLASGPQSKQRKRSVTGNQSKLHDNTLAFVHRVTVVTATTIDFRFPLRVILIGRCILPILPPPQTRWGSRAQFDCKTIFLTIGFILGE